MRERGRRRERKRKREEEEDEVSSPREHLDSTESLRIWSSA